MEIRIGVTHTPKEIEVEMGEGVDRAAILAGIEAALGGEEKVLWLTDRKGRRFGIPTERVAYVEVDSETEGSRRVGFSAL